MISSKQLGPFFNTDTYLQLVFYTNLYLSCDINYYYRMILTRFDISVGNIAVMTGLQRHQLSKMMSGHEGIGLKTRA